MSPWLRRRGRRGRTKSPKTGGLRPLALTCPGDDALVVFVHYFTEAPVDQAVAQVAIHQLREDMAGWAGSAYRNGEELAGRLGGGAGLASMVLFSLGEGRITATGLVYPLTWRATGAASLFPRLVGELELADMGAAVLITLRGNYDPPLGSLGRVVDRALLGRVADATVKSWVDRLAAEVVGLDRHHDLDGGSGPGGGGDSEMTVKSKRPAAKVG